MKFIVVDHDREIAAFMCERMGIQNAFQSGRGVGMLNAPLGDTPRLVAGIWFEQFNGANMMMHVAADPDFRARWMTRELLWYTFHYPFIECGCRRVTGVISASNKEAIEFDERIGFRYEATLKDAAPDGDMLVYVMFREDCRWLKLRDRIPHLRRQVN